ncbi:hypothetical protein Goshw_014930 [Gossypium schwendimanii]|uniref:Uncharacterized protein n=1 Tax=Gossypium schwendimanii TaxID=34291 RepID=A0A7J9N255_GOSSC|nr:hypothetical protein [Gossypium schwendimanii]
MWEDRYKYIPTMEPIIVPELACVQEYMPWFKIHGKPYLLSAEEKQRQLRVQMERCGPLNPRRRDEDACLSTRPRNSPGPSSVPITSSGPTPTQSLDPTIQPTIPPMYRPESYDGSQEGPSGSSSFYQSPSPYGF